MPADSVLIRLYSRLKASKVPISRPLTFFKKADPDSDY